MIENEIAEPGDIIRVYLDLGPKMSNLLKLFSEEEPGSKFAKKILASFKDEIEAMQPIILNRDLDKIN